MLAQSGLKYGKKHIFVEYKQYNIHALFKLIQKRTSGLNIRRIRWNWFQWMVNNHNDNQQLWKLLEHILSIFDIFLFLSEKQVCILHYFLYRRIKFLHWREKCINNIISNNDSGGGEKIQTHNICIHLICLHSFVVLVEIKNCVCISKVNRKPKYIIQSDRV